MIIGKSLLIATVLAFAPFAASAVNAQDQRNAMATEHQDRATDRNRQDQRDMRDMRNRDNRDMRDRDRRDMHRGWHNGHHYGWHRHCMMTWRHHHRVRVCR